MRLLHLMNSLTLQVGNIRRLRFAHPRCLAEVADPEGQLPTRLRTARQSRPVKALRHVHADRAVQAHCHRDMVVRMTQAGACLQAF